MTRGINNVLLIGSLARDPELRYAPSGLAILNFTLAGDSKIHTDDGERNVPWYQRTSLIGKQAEALAETLKAGDAVLLEGSLDYRSWENEAGEKRSKLEVKAQRLEVLQAGERTEALVRDAIGGLRLTDAVNRVTVSGNLTRDAQVRVTPNGVSVASLSIATTESWKDANGEWQERTHFVDITLWREMADAVSSLTKGTPVLVTGRVVTDSWTDKDGSKRNAVKIEADRLEVLVRASKPDGAQSGQGQAAPQARERVAPNRKPATQAQTRGRKVMPPETEDMPF
jgi:single-strand DNA-binding protein